MWPFHRPTKKDWETYDKFVAHQQEPILRKMFAMTDEESASEEALRLSAIKDLLKHPATEDVLAGLEGEGITKEPTWIQYLSDDIKKYFAAHPWEHPYTVALRKLKQALRDGGELWYWRNANEEWDKGFGQAGYAVVKDGEITATILTEMN
jgi:hypothetical protein